MKKLKTMKKLLLILLCVPLIGFGQERYHMDEVITPGKCPYDTITYLKKDMSLVNGTVFYDNQGYLAIEYNYKDGKKHGPRRIWSKNGQLEIEYNYKEGKRHGLWRVWFENGQLEIETNYKDNRIIYEKCWDEQGIKIECE